MLFYDAASKKKFDNNFGDVEASGMPILLLQLKLAEASIHNMRLAAHVEASSSPPVHLTCFSLALPPSIH
jgi:hypothetical protein